MNFSITSEERNSYLYMEVKGVVSDGEELAAHSKILYDKIGKLNHTKIIIVQSELLLPFDIVSYFDLVKDYINSYPPEIYHLKIVAIFSEENKLVGDTWETLCQSRGLKFYSFTSIEEGLDCLLMEDEDELSDI
ncbi:MAG: hypothetical protein ABIN48_02530 [Ginsengibacter sp.]